MLEIIIGLLVIAGIILIPWMVGRIYWILNDDITNNFDKEWSTGVVIIIFLIIVLTTSWYIGFCIIK